MPFSTFTTLHFSEKYSIIYLSKSIRFDEMFRMLSLHIPACTLIYAVCFFTHCTLCVQIIWLKNILFEPCCSWISPLSQFKILFWLDVWMHHRDYGPLWDCHYWRIIHPNHFIMRTAKLPVLQCRIFFLFWWVTGWIRTAYLCSLSAVST